jgi:integrase/recombinase XerC/integrase/recombinase XerD
MYKPRIDLSRLIQHFEVHNRSEGKSPRTVGWYNEVLWMFHDWLGAEGLSTTLGSVGDMAARRFILHIQEKPGLKDAKMSSHSVANRVRALKAFFAWLARKGYTADHLLKDLRIPKTEQKVMEPLTKEELDKVFAAINRSTALGARNASIVALMLDTGLRLSEVAHLKEMNVHHEERYVKVMGKGSKERMIAFGVACQRSLLDYCHHFRVEPAHPGVDTFFLTIDGYPMKPEAIKSLFDRLSGSAGVQRLHPHLLRHTYATCFLLNGGDVFLLKQNLGHSTLAMVQHYLHIASQRAAIRSQGFSPLDRFDVAEDRRFKHAFAGPNGRNNKIYPHPGIGHNRVSGGGREKRGSSNPWR